MVRFILIINNTKLINLVVLLCIFSIKEISSQDLQCPPCDGKDFKLETIYTQDECKEDYYVVEKSVCECFPSCVKKQGFESPCNAVKRFCAPGLMCGEDTGYCILDRTSCLHYDFIREEFDFKHLPLWKPTCLPDGSYAPVQCKGEKPSGRCFCYDAKGKRIFGSEWWRKADNMTCACSRRVAELKEMGRTDVTLHCNSLGNYEPLQCDSGLCWCAEPHTGKIIGQVVIEELMEKLECYNGYEIGDQYLRKCESQAIAQARIQIELKKHGTHDITMPYINCDFDGSYGHFQLEKSTIYCTWRDGSRIDGSQSASVGLNMFDCNCARDKKLFELEGESSIATCDVYGNYKPDQDLNGRTYCVDSDGFAVSEVQPEGVNPDCKDWIYARDEPGEEETEEFKQKTIIL